ncbi:hypothetical protein MMC22_009751 [Lobaria immixta]|nr:hypothetical protein [Lobaria immixta]
MEHTTIDTRRSVKISKPTNIYSKVTSECPQPSSSAFNNPGTTNPETATAENVYDLYQQTLPPGTTNPETATAENVDNPYHQTLPYIGSNPALPANPIFNDHTGNSNIFSFAPLDMGTLRNARISEGTEAQTQDAQTQDWLTNLFRDPKEFSIFKKRARKSSRDFRWLFFDCNRGISVDSFSPRMVFPTKWAVW